MVIATGTLRQTLDQALEMVNVWTVQMEDRALNLAPVLQPIADEILDMVRTSAQTRISPTGITFLPLTETTLKLYGDGTVPEPTGRLANSFQVQIQGTNILISSPLVYASTQMYGNPENKLFGGPLAPIPARPYLDFNEAGDLIFPEDTLQRWMDKVFTYIVEGTL